MELKEPDDARALPAPSYTGKDFFTEATISVGKFSINVNSKTPKELIQTLMEVAAHVE